MIEQEKAIFIEYCNNCNSHVWCTKHDESRYSGFFATIKQELEKHFNGLTIYGNTNPLTGKSIIPSLGAFEVYYMKRKVFSKLKTSTWPTINVISSKIKSIIEGNVPEDCEVVDYAYDDTATEKKRKTIRIQKHLKRTLDYQNGSTRNDLYPSTLTSLPTENQQQEFRSLCWDKNCREKSNTFIDLDKKINKRATPTKSTRPDQNKIKLFSQTMYAKKQEQSNVNKKIYPKINNENYFLPPKNAFVSTTTKSTYPQSLNEMSLSLQTMTDFNNICPSCPESVHNKDGMLSIRKNEQQFNGAGNDRNNHNFNRLKPLHNSANKTTQARHSKSEMPVSKRQKRSHSQDMTITKDLDQELNEATVFSLRIQEPSALENKIVRKRKDYKELQWFPEDLNHRSSPENFEEKIQSENKSNSRPGILGNDYELIDPVFSNNQQDYTGRANSMIASKLKNIKFPEEKLSQIKVARKASSKKKITIVPDEKNDCNIEIYFTHPQINGLSSHQFIVAKGCPFKIPLKFNYQEIKFLTGFCIFILKNGCPWQKIMLDLTFL